MGGLKIAKLVGAAGTGKTHRLMDTLDKMAERFGSPMEVGFVTFTRAARAEAVERASDRFVLPPTKLRNKGWFRTLHSCCHRILQIDDQLVADNAEGRQWVGEVLEEPVHSLDGDLLNETTARKEPKTDAEKALGMWSTARNRLGGLEEAYDEQQQVGTRLPPLDWCQETIKKYEKAKWFHDRLDFTDLLLQVAGYRCSLDGVEKVAPQGTPPQLSAWIHDEAQDASNLSHAVFERLIHAPGCKFAVSAADPFQAIFSFAGSDSRHFMQMHADKEETMPRSYRCAAPILELGERLLRDCDDYFDRNVRPAEHEGRVIQWGVDDLAVKIDPREDWLVLARSNQLVNSLARDLDNSSIPWRPTKGSGRWAKTIRTVAIRTLAAMQRGEPVRAVDWVDVLKTLPSEGWFIRGTKTHWQNLVTAEQRRTTEPVPPSDWALLGLTEEGIGKIKSGEWIGKIDLASSYLKALDRWGGDVVDAPAVRVGTIHSAKGAEAANVALLSTMPKPCQRAMSVDSLADAERRVWYVGVTRAKSRLVILDDETTTVKKAILTL